MEALDLGTATFLLLKSVLPFRGQRLGFSFETTGEEYLAMFLYSSSTSVPSGEQMLGRRHIPGCGCLVGFQNSLWQWFSNFKCVHQHYLEDLLKQGLLGPAPSFSFCNSEVERENL